MRPPRRTGQGACLGNGNRSVTSGVTARRRQSAAFAAVLGICCGSPLAAQTSATLGMSASIVEYEGFLASSAATLTPSVRFDSPDVSAGAQGSWTVFESGNQIFQATAAAGWLIAVGSPWRVELSGAAGASKYADEPGSGHFLARSRLHILSGRTGGWVGATAGAVSGGSAELPFEIESGLWGVRNRLTLVGTVTGAWLGGDHHLDLLAAGRWTNDRVELETRVGARPWTDSGGDIGEAVTGVFAEVSALFSVTSRIALVLGGGSYPADPVRRVLAARYVTAGIRLAIVPPPPATASPGPAGATLAALRSRAPENDAGTRLEIEAAGPLHALRVHVSGAKSVELMADFTDWQPIALARVDPGIWEVELALAPGVHRLNIRVDGGEWLVPDGARAEPGEFGGAVGVVTVR